MAVVALVLAGLASLLAALWLYFSWHFDYWRKRGVPSCNTLAVFGGRGGLALGRRPLFQALDAVYEQHRGSGQRFVGAFQARRPVLVVLEPELAKVVLTKDFASFQGRGQPFDEEGDPLSANLFHLVGPRWKNLRSRLSPTFTSGKLKGMYPLMAAVTDQLSEYLEDKAAAKQDVEFKDVLVRYATDVIGSVAFGIDCHSLKQGGAQGANDAFHAMTREVFDNNFLFIVRLFVSAIHPKLVKLMPSRWLFRRTSHFFLKLMRDTVEYREAHRVDRHDFVGLMMQLREADRRGELDRTRHVALGPDAMAAQAFVFFVAGLDNTANTVGFALHELGMDFALQERAAAEVREAKAKHGGLTYDAVRSLDLVERIIRESLRKWTPIGLLTRQPDDKFKIPDSDVVIDSRVLVWVPVWQMMHDPEHFPDPERFDPERFTEEAKERRPAYTYLPFGAGPRVCIAERYAVLEMKLCLASLLCQYKFSLGRDAQRVPELNPKCFSPTPKSGFWLRIEKRN